MIDEKVKRVEPKQKSSFKRASFPEQLESLKGKVIHQYFSSPKGRTTLADDEMKGDEWLESNYESTKDAFPKSFESLKIKNVGDVIGT